jgi:hypothetical protein
MPDFDKVDVRREEIWAFKQNKPTLIAKDLELFYDVPRRSTYKILLARGVFKWFAVRRDLIKLKDHWKSEVRWAITLIHKAKSIKDRRNHWYLKGYLKAKEECRADIRKLCHSDRWQAPDNDRDANRFLEEQS